MATDHLPLLTSEDFRQRGEGLRNLLKAFAKSRDLESPDGLGLAALFALILHQDPSPSIRYMVLDHPLCPLDALSGALLDSDSAVRRTAVEVLCRKTMASGHANVYAPKLFNLLALETNDSTIITVLHVLQVIYTKSSTLPDGNVTLTALGHTQIDKPAQDGHEIPEYFAVIRDVAEHDSMQSRRALCPLLVALIAMVSEPGSSPTRDDLHISRLSFEIIDTLLQDVYECVQIAAVDALLQLGTLEKCEYLRKTGLFSDLSAKCLLRLVKLRVNREVDDRTRRVLDLFRFYSFATLTGYNLVENFLRERWYQARVSAVRKENGAENVAGFIRDSLVGVMKSNTDFAQVLDLKRGLSDKSGSMKPQGT